MKNAVLQDAISSKPTHGVYRDQAIDLIKAIAIIGVVTIHTCTNGFYNTIGSTNWVASLFYASAARGSVPLFFMCSGALLLSPAKELPVKRLYKNNFLHILRALLVWATAYMLLHLVINRNFTAAALLHGLTDVITFKHEGHLYFLHILLLVYAFLPITRIYVKNADKKNIEYLLFIWFITGIAIPTVYGMRTFSPFSGIFSEWKMSMTYAAIGYGVLGYYLKTYSHRRSAIYILMFLFGFSFTFMGTWYGSIKSGQLYQRFLEGMSIGPFCLAFGIFGLCGKINSYKGNRVFFGVITYISKASFAIYLIHVFAIYVFTKYGISVQRFSCVFSIPALVFANLICCIPAYQLLSHIPLLRRCI